MDVTVYPSTVAMTSVATATFADPIAAANVVVAVDLPSLSVTPTLFPPCPHGQTYQVTVTGTGLPTNGYMWISTAYNDEGIGIVQSAALSLVGGKLTGIFTASQTDGLLGVYVIGLTVGQIQQVAGVVCFQ